MKTVAILNAKGGVGKTTLAVHLAMHFDAVGHKVGVLDSDPMGAAKAWLTKCSERVLATSVTSASSLGYHHFNSSKLFDVLVIDGVARMAEEAVVAVGLADAVLLPVTASSLDCAAVDMTAALLRAVQEELRGRPWIGVVLNAIRRGTRFANELMETGQPGGFARCQSVLFSREAYRQAAHKGTVVERLGYRARQAAAEMERFYQEVETVLGIESDHGRRIRRPRRKARS